jgi:hypothetical protein
MIHRIFGAAHVVIVGFGEAVALNTSTIQAMIRDFQVAKTYTHDQLEALELGALAVQRSHITTNEVRPAARHLVLLSQLSRQDWMTRLWCLQEFVLARRVQFLIAWNVVSEDTIVSLCDEPRSVPGEPRPLLQYYLSL